MRLPPEHALDLESTMTIFGGATTSVTLGLVRLLLWGFLPRRQTGKYQETVSNAFGFILCWRSEEVRFEDMRCHTACDMPY